MYHTNRTRFGLIVLTALLLLALALPALAQNSTSITTIARLRLRAEPTTRSESLAVIPVNTTLNALAVNASLTWVQVNFNGRTGWVSTRFISVTSGSLAGLPVGGSSTTATGATADNSGTGAIRIELTATPEVPAPNTSDAVLAGGCVNLAWRVPDARVDWAITLSINTADQRVVASDTLRVCLTQTTLFTLAVEPGDGRPGAFAQATIRVVAP